MRLEGDAASPDWLGPGTAPGTSATTIGKVATEPTSSPREETQAPPTGGRGVRESVGGSSGDGVHRGPAFDTPPQATNETRLP